ncbi:MAG TPA: AbrB/MazE/SpoVT family DNA-binding domain-containing protein [Syntrophomonadaceae bacterium]|nr:AbrB/MazE/SpoVT family DNA-binding domain-containing protein [Syntrophomonadaceae bacterium]
MHPIASITIDEEYGQIVLPVEIGQKLNLSKFDWLKVSIQSDQVVISVARDQLDEELLAALIHEGLLIDPK